MTEGAAETVISLAQTDNSVYSCSYKIIATSGAPGFKFSTNAATGNVLIHWYEFDGDQITGYATNPASMTTWPALGTTSSELDCGNACIQGELVMRTKTVNGVASNVNAYQMLEALNAKRADYEKYTIEANAVREFNGALITPSVFDTVFGGKVVTAPKNMPARPTDFSGDTFKGSGATTTQGGYGKKSTGNLATITQSVDTGYKPFGALGQGTDKNKAVSLDHGNKNRVMIVTIYPKLNTDNSASTQTLTLGAYGW